MHTVVVGTIIASVLNYDEFCRAMDQNPAVDSRKSSYAPCDGRSVAGSYLSRCSAMSNAPDLRGKFLRGLNMMYDIGQPLPFDPETQGDPEPGRIVSTYQPDAYKSHAHGYDRFNDGKITDMSNDKDQRRTSYGDNSGGQTGFSGEASETRPRNVAVYYYIKIN